MIKSECNSPLFPLSFNGRPQGRAPTEPFPDTVSAPDFPLCEKNLLSSVIKSECNSALSPLSFNGRPQGRAPTEPFPTLFLPLISQRLYFLNCSAFFILAAAAKFL